MAEMSGRTYYMPGMCGRIQKQTKTLKMNFAVSNVIFCAAGFLP